MEILKQRGLVKPSGQHPQVIRESMHVETRAGMFSCDLLGPLCSSLARCIHVRLGWIAACQNSRGHRKSPEEMVIVERWAYVVSGTRQARLDDTKAPVESMEVVTARLVSTGEITMIIRRNDTNDEPPRRLVGVGKALTPPCSKLQNGNTLTSPVMEHRLQREESNSSNFDLGSGDGTGLAGKSEKRFRIQMLRSKALVCVKWVVTNMSTARTHEQFVARLDQLLHR
ncbi:hypothetical protein JAAARDRAFT_623764 [Jaapia argillacea MUCL 33604]|uniref:Uncharacterized protein n=1 Tax=Jaapia argillacea MUCL 33604 TaxID=933084 RepID=A0A067Q7P5_9AGAM|nr:hypothetical protein JAAARDRAFT_623764 [Jaapia argillacea MUCL 33604]